MYILSSMSILEALPEELVIMIMARYPARKLLRSRVVSQDWKRLSQDPSVWKDKCEWLCLSTSRKPSYKSWEWFCLAHIIVHKNEEKENTVPPPKDWAIGTYVTKRGNNSVCTSIGEWLDGSLNGFGIKMWLEGDVYTGTFDKGYKYLGKKVYLNGDTYDGHWNQEVRTGKGKYQWAQGDFYEGEWGCGNLHGEGAYVWNDGRYYNGHWSRHNQEGLGCFIWPDGTSYCGGWGCKGKRHGYGIMFMVDAKTGEVTSTWEGYWENDIRVQKGGYVDEEARSFNNYFPPPLETEDEKLRWDGFFLNSFPVQREEVKRIMASLPRV